MAGGNGPNEVAAVDVDVDQGSQPEPADYAADEAADDGVVEEAADEGVVEAADEGDAVTAENAERPDGDWQVWCAEACPCSWSCSHLAWKKVKKWSYTGPAELKARVAQHLLRSTNHHDIATLEKAEEWAEQSEISTYMESKADRDAYWASLAHQKQIQQ